MAERAVLAVASLVLALWLGACVSLEPPPPEVTLVAATPGAAAENQRLPAELCRGLFIVELAFPRQDGAGAETLRFLLDTGAWPTSVDPDSVARLTGRPVSGSTATLSDGRSGPLRLTRLPASYHRMGDLSLALGRRIDGILGHSAFTGVLLTLDYPRGEVRVEAGELPEPDGETVWPTHGSDRPYLPLDLGERTVQVLVDSGYSGGLTLRADDPVDWAAPPRSTGAVVRYSSVALTRAGRTSESWRLGPASIEGPVVRVAEHSRLIGSEVLRHFAWTFDQRHRRVRIAAAGGGPVRLPAERGSGLALAPRGDEFEVLALLPGTPAEASGVRVGDRLLAVDGVPVAERGCVGITETAASEQLLTLRRGGEELELPVAVVDLVP